MKRNTTLMVSIFSVATCFLIHSAEIPKDLFIDSVATNDLFVRLATSRQGSNLLTTDPISLSFFTLTNPVVDLFIPKADYFVKPELFDGDGKPLPLTSLGKKLGSRFAKIDRFPNSAVEMRRGSYRMTIAHPHAAEGIPLFRIEDVFIFKQPGSYTLHAEIQVFRRTRIGGKPGIELVRLPRLKWAVTRE